MEMPAKQLMISNFLLLSANLNQEAFSLLLLLP